MNTDQTAPKPRGAHAFFALHAAHVVRYYAHKGGMALTKQQLSERGARGGFTTWERYSIYPIGINLFVMYDRESGAFKAFYPNRPYNMDPQEEAHYRSITWTNMPKIER